MADFYHQKPSQGFLYHLDFTYVSIAGLLVYAPCILELSPQVGVSGGVHRARRLLPPQVGVLGGVRPSAPVAVPSVGVLGSVLVVSPFLSTGPPSSLLGTFLGPRI